MDIEKKNRVFLISQVGDKGTDVRKRADNIADYIVKPVAETFGLEVLRSDRDPTPGPVTSQLLRSILDSRVAIADLTGRNPNVYYELCFAHSFGVPVIILVYKVATLSFDVKNERVIEVGDNGNIAVDQAENAKNELRKALGVVTAEGYSPTSLVTEAARVQRLESLAPEDAEASELADIKQRLDDIFVYVAQSSKDTGRSRRSEQSKDLGKLVRLVNELAGNGRLSKEEVQKLIDPETSPSFDDWITDRVVPSIPSPSPLDLTEEDFDDIPF